MRSVLPALLMLALPLGGCLEAADVDSAAAPQGTPLSFRTLPAPPVGTTPEVYEDERAWLDAWHGGHAAPPFVDFGRERVVAVGLGERPSTCYGADVTAVRRVNGTTWVEVTERRPGPEMACGAAMTNPRAAAAVPADDSPVRVTTRVHTGASGESAYEPTPRWYVGDRWAYDIARADGATERVAYEVVGVTNVLWDVAYEVRETRGGVTRTTYVDVNTLGRIWQGCEGESHECVGREQGFLPLSGAYGPVVSDGNRSAFATVERVAAYAFASPVLHAGEAWVVQHRPFDCETCGAARVVLAYAPQAGLVAERAEFDAAGDIVERWTLASVESVRLGHPNGECGRVDARVEGERVVLRVENCGERDVIVADPAPCAESTGTSVRVEHLGRDWVVRQGAAREDWLDGCTTAPFTTLGVPAGESREVELSWDGSFHGYPCEEKDRCSGGYGTFPAPRGTYEFEVEVRSLGGSVWQASAAVDVPARADR